MIEQDKEAFEKAVYGQWSLDGLEEKEETIREFENVHKAAGRPDRAEKVREIFSASPKMSNAGANWELVNSIAESKEKKKREDALDSLGVAESSEILRDVGDFLVDCYQIIFQEVERVFSFFLFFALCY